MKEKWKIRLTGSGMGAVRGEPLFQSSCSLWLEWSQRRGRMHGLEVELGSEEKSPGTRDVKWDSLNLEEPTGSCQESSGGSV